jgi:8-amino-3,8-dideoxy-alpha-D-manno-octulosonate transaminase
MSQDFPALQDRAPARARPLPPEFPGAAFIDDEEVQAVERVLRARSPFRYYGIDPQYETRQFEKEFAGYLGVAHALGVTSGTGALHTALAALRAGPGQEVIIPAYLWASVAAAVVNRGAIPVLADIDDTFCLSPAAVERRITPRTTGVVMIHMSGAPGDAPGVAAVARRHGLFLLEDCAQCAGGSIGGRMAGTFGDIAVFSFQLNKNMTAGEGGCVVTSDPVLYRRAVASHDIGYGRSAAGRLEIDSDLCLWGMGYRLDELRGAVLRVQLRKLPNITAAMRRSKYRIMDSLRGFQGVSFRRVPDPQGDTGAFLILTFEDGRKAGAVVRSLRESGLAPIPMTEWGLHLYYRNLSLLQRSSVDGRGFPWNLPANAESRPAYEKGACPAADDLFERSVLMSIPSCLSQEDEDYAIQVLKAAVAG